MYVCMYVYSRRVSGRGMNEKGLLCPTWSMQIVGMAITVLVHWAGMRGVFFKVPYHPAILDPMCAHVHCTLCKTDQFPGAQVQCR